MSDIAGIAGNAVMAYQNALATVSNNIANVATDGYSRQDATLTALPVTPAGNFFLGSGVIVGTVKRSTTPLSSPICATRPVTWQPRGPW